MNTGARTSLIAPATGTGNGHGNPAVRSGGLRERVAEFGEKKKARVYVAAENRLLQEALARMLAKKDEIANLDEDLKGGEDRRLRTQGQ